MITRYEIDLSGISITKFKQLIISRNVHPSRMPLYNGLDDILQMLESYGIKNLNDVIKALSTKNKLEQLADTTGISFDYLVLLNREAKSYKTKVVAFDKIPGIDITAINCLKRHQLLKSKKYFEEIIKTKPDLIVEKLGLLKDQVLELFYLADLVRVWGVGPVFARIVLESGVHSVKKLQSIDMTVYYPEFLKINAKKKYTTARFSLNDVLYCQQMAQELDVIEINENV